MAYSAFKTPILVLKTSETLLAQGLSQLLSLLDHPDDHWGEHCLTLVLTRNLTHRFSSGQ